MKTTLFTGLALAAALLVSSPAYARDARGGGGGARGHAVAAVHRAGGGGRIAASRGFRGGARQANIASRRTVNAGARRDLAVNRNVARNHFAARGNFASRNVARKSVAFGGNSNANTSHYKYAFASHGGWNRNQQYFWHGHHYGWYNNAWYIVDPFPWYAGYYGPGYYGPGYYGYNNGGGSVSVAVQTALSQQGYYRGPIDGVVGPGTRAAIAAYQRDNGLPVTGTITPGVLNDLGVG